jgi:hypothetical protein
MKVFVTLGKRNPCERRQDNKLILSVKVKNNLIGLDISGGVGIFTEINTPPPLLLTFMVYY